MKFFDTVAGKWFVIVALLLLAAWFVWRRVSGGVAKAAGTAANAVNFTDPNNISYTKATEVGKGWFGSSFTLSDLFPTSSAEKRVNEMFKKQPAGIQAPRAGDTTLADVQAKASTIIGSR